MGNSIGTRHVVNYHPRGCGPRVKSEEYDLVDGLMEGLYKSWYPNGIVRRLCIYHKGKLCNKDITWNERGALSYVHRVEEEPGPEGRIRHTEYWDDGSPQREYTVKTKPWDQNHGGFERDGVYRQWSATGCLVEESLYRNGVYDGAFTTYYDDAPGAKGTKKSEGTYRAGEVDGPYRTWHPNGVPEREANYVKGVPRGLCRQWRADGTQSQECGYDKYGRLKGILTEWYAGGGVNKVVEYRRGKVVRVVELRDPAGRDCVLPPGELIVWKACAVPREGTGDAKKGVNVKRGVYVKIMVPADAQRVTPLDTDAKFKSRVEYGVVLDIESAPSADGTVTHYNEATSFVYGKDRLRYVVGERVQVDEDDFEDDPNVECGAGINVHLHRDHCAVWFQSTPI